MKLEDILAKIDEIGHKRNMNSADIQAIRESLKHLQKKFEKS
jgi:peptidoglycan hydrolase CwlO-like protein